MAILFCPFCRECFEDTARCPEHDLALVAFEALPRTKEEWHDDDVLPPGTPQFGRGEVAGAAIASWVAFLAPFVEVVAGPRHRSFSAMSAASSSAPILWVWPFAGALFASVLLRRKTRRALRSARLGVAFIALMPALALGYAVFRIRGGAAEQGMDVHFLFGTAFAALASALGWVGALRLGGARTDTARAGPSQPD